jgi:hypothetical protein
VGYDSGSLQATAVYRLSRRLEAIVGPYVSRYESDDSRNETNSYGLVFGGGYAPAESAYLVAQLRAEQADVTENNPAPFSSVSNTQSSVGFELMGHYSWPASRIRYNIGRFLEPSTIGSRVKNDVFRVQYTRSLSARLLLIGALRLDRDNRIEGTGTGGTNEQRYVDLAVNYQLTPTWYVGSGYRYIQQDLSTEVRNAKDHSVYLQFGYRALDPRPRRAQ